MQHVPPVSSASILCAQCGYDLSGQALGGACPECGMSVAATIQRRSYGTKSCGKATACMVLGIVSIAACMLCGPVAIFLYYLAKAEMDRGGYSESSRTMAKAGLITGIIGTAILALYGFILLLGVSL